MVMQIATQRYYTPEEYLDLEVNSDDRHEYIDGEIITMTGGTPRHNQLALNISGTLNFILRRQPYQVFVTDQRLWIPRKRIHTYPDVMVVHGELQFQERRTDTIVNPCLIAEVLSNSTRSYDKDGKFAAYRTIASFQEYVLIDQYSVHVEHYCKTDSRRWTYAEYDSQEDTVEFTSVPAQISLADIYNKVVFVEEEPEKEPMVDDQP